MELYEAQREFAWLIESDQIICSSIKRKDEATTNKKKNPVHLKKKKNYP